ncbi:unnamed protein product [Lecanosticta acicola]|uniref:Unnamed protein product n=1 Tax=Lecanosticta acicola TaxID=111012 RepID=A0AAI9EE61_9PEZI|nr:unnamed protein product [Lecanosticta acicola]
MSMSMSIFTLILRLAVCLCALLVSAALANTEKAIFLAPEAITLPDASPSLHALQLDTISPISAQLRTALPVAFPSDTNPKGLESWYLLRQLNARQRYEVRICWAAVQPTQFWIDVYNITHVFDTPHLIQSLASYSEEQQQQQQQQSPQPVQPKAAHTALDLSGTILFLHLHAAADFFTTNKTLMHHPPAVDVDIILDPYLANILPASLLPTALYILVLAILSWFLSGANMSSNRSTQANSSNQGAANGLGTSGNDGNSGDAQQASPSTTVATATPAAPPSVQLHPFYTLPVELILDIVDYLPAEAFINFAFANYPILHHHGLAPALSRPRIIYITTQTQIPALFPLLRMPPEIMLHIMRNLRPIDIMRFVVANYQDLARQGIAPPMTEETVNQLKNAVRARLGPGSSSPGGSDLGSGPGRPGQGPGTAT